MLVGMMLFAGLCGYLYNEQFDSAKQSQSAAVEPEAAPRRTRRRSSEDTPWQFLTVPALAAYVQNNTIPKDWLQEWEGTARYHYEFVELSKFKFYPGATLTLVVLLSNPLNKEVEDRWRLAGILMPDSEGFPFIRTVKILTEEDIEQLLDWRIAGLAEKQLSRKPAQ